MGAFEKDESPYGVRDMAGSVSEWTDDWVDAGRTMKVTCGGSWSGDSTVALQVTTKTGLGPLYRTSSLGFRLVKILDREH